MAEVIKQSRRAGDHENVFNDLPDLEKAFQLISDVTNQIETRMEEYDRKRRCRSIERKFVNLKVGALGMRCPHPLLSVDSRLPFCPSFDVFAK